MLGNYFDSLQIDMSLVEQNLDNAEFVLKEVKKGYVKMLRKYPPEKAPEEYKKIQEAYEVLGDLTTLREYIAFQNYGEQINEHERLGGEALEKEDYKTAIREFKKILLIEPSLSFAKNKLGLALAYDGQYDLAIAQFQEIIAKNPKNATFLSNLAYTYNDKKEYDKAEEAWLKAYELDPLNDDIILAISRLYRNEDQYNKAVSFLRSCIGKNKNDKFQDFMYYFEIIMTYVYEHNIEMIEKVIDEVEQIIPDDKESKEYVSWKFGKLAYDLFEYKIYNISERIAYRAMQIDNSEAITNLYNEAKKWNEAYTLYDKLSNDDRVVGPLKGPIYYFLHGDEYDEEDFGKKLDENTNAIQSYIDGDYDSVINSINIIKNEYSLLYNYKKEAYEEACRIASENKRRDLQWDKLENDSNVPNGLIRLIALWLTSNLSESERKKYFDDIIDEIGRESSNKVISGINRIKTLYPDLYNLNSDALKRLYDIAKQNNTSSSQTAATSTSYNTGNTSKTNSNTTGTRTSSNKNNNTSGTNNASKTSSNTTGTYNTSSTTNNSAKPSSNSSSGSGCLPIIIGAIIGGLIVPGVGLFIGGAIGYWIANKS